MSYKRQPDLSDSARIAVIEQMVGETHARLFGNGQPGEIEHLKSRLTKLESWRSQWAGAAALAALLVSALPKLWGVLHL